MDSRLTLVDHSALTDRYANTVLVFDRDSFLNATLSIQGGETTVYKICTEKSGSRTELRRTGPEPSSEDVLVALIERNEIFPDTIAFYGQPPIKISKWLKHRTFSVVTESTATARYVWKPLNLFEIALFMDNNPFTPIAWFRTAHISDVDGVRTRSPPYISLQPDAEHIEDFVLASLIIVEHKYRMKAKKAAVYPPS